MNKEKLDQNIKAKLFSANSDIVISAINKIKVKGNKHYIPILFDLLLSDLEKEVEKEITNLLETVKVKDTAEIFVQALENEKYKSIRKIILIACWQNGLEYQPYLPVFVDVIIKEEWETAFEAFTVIDNMEFLPEKGIINQTKHKINTALKTATDKKEYFLQEILLKIE